MGATRANSAVTEPVSRRHRPACVSAESVQTEPERALVAPDRAEPGRAEPQGARTDQPTVSACRTRSVRMPCTSPERMIATRSPANDTAAMITIAYSAVAAPVSSRSRLGSRGRGHGAGCPDAGADGAGVGADEEKGAIAT
jgi:hypothetical protein